MTWFWRLVFWWKKLTGFLDLKQQITITGTVIQRTQPDLDGDDNFDVQLDAGQERWITGFGGRLTMADPILGPSIHCEITKWAHPELRSVFDQLRRGDRVTVTGSWGFDGVHTPGRPLWWEVLRALLRHPPNVEDGWFELHPVTQVTVRTQPRSGSPHLP